MLRKSLSEVAIELRETQHEIAAKQQELQTMERHITKRTEQVDELEEQQRLGWPQYRCAGEFEFEGEGARG